MALILVGLTFVILADGCRGKVKARRIDVAVVLEKK